MNKYRISYKILYRLFLAQAVCVSLANLCGWMMQESPYHTLMRQSLLGIGLLVGGFAALVWYIGKTSLVVRLFLRLAQPEFPPLLQSLIHSLGLEGQVVLISHRQPIVFCFGFWRPRICLSSGLLDLLSPAELKAVLLHEDSHRQNRDPLRILLLEVIRTTFLFLPILREWGDVYKIGLELRADQYAVNRVGRKAVAGALYRFYAQSASINLPKAAIAGLSANDARIAALLGDSDAVPAISSKNLLLSSLALWMICLLLMV